MLQNSNDDESTAGKFADIREQFVRHLWESSTSILVVAPHNVEQAMIEFAGLSFQVETDSRYLGSFIGEATERHGCITNTVGGWVYSIKKLAHRVHILLSSAQCNKNGSIYNAQQQH